MKKIKIQAIVVLVLSALFIMGCDKGNSVKIYQSAEEMVKDAEQNVKQLTVQELGAMLDKSENFILIDVRELDEHNAGFIPGSILIARGVLEFRIAKTETWEAEGLYAPKKEDAIVIYDKLGHRGILAAETLAKLGYTNVKVVKGGWAEWEKAFPDKIEKIETPLAPVGTSAGETKSGGC